MIISARNGQPAWQVLHSGRAYFEITVNFVGSSSVESFVPVIDSSGWLERISDHFADNPIKVLSLWNRRGVNLSHGWLFGWRKWLEVHWVSHRLNTIPLLGRVASRRLLLHVEVEGLDCDSLGVGIHNLEDLRVNATLFVHVSSAFACTEDESFLLFIIPVVNVGLGHLLDICSWVDKVFPVEAPAYGTRLCPVLISFWAYRLLWKFSLVKLPLLRIGRVTIPCFLEVFSGLEESFVLLVWCWEESSVHVVGWRHLWWRNIELAPKSRGD